MICDTVIIRFVENIGSIAMIVISPVGHRTKSCSGGKYIRRGKHSHQRDEAAIGAAVKTNTFRVDAIGFYQPFHTVHIIIKVFLPPCDDR